MANGLVVPGEFSAEPSVDGIKIPLYLQPGDTIGITCPSGYMSIEDIQPVLNKMKEWGFEIRVGETVAEPGRSLNRGRSFGVWESKENCL